ncbi:D-Ala-D-Ala carboxypeptidase family metallohydrolase [Chondromyces crocatus]|uniref:Peptidase M15A C-terminal domain-containing protein n=1 Tax=Chondromyces crocatus TaxID=52 RepID=A0A0K1EKT9_CHOCO|nr:D-Ala-D-Ala carboxypeptidase family metallohydrolase [Chondromyces crocatus]AKT41228.1 uncharacterized protein CMC5_053890 [Chondromyces crocatus]
MGIRDLMNPTGIAQRPELTAPALGSAQLFDPNTSGTPGGFTEGTSLPGQNTQSFSRTMSDAGTAADGQLGTEQADGACSTCPFVLRLEHRSRYTAMPKYSDQEWVPRERFIFLVGQGRVLSVRVAEPEGAVATWEVTPVGAYSGTVDPSTGSGNRFDYTPVVTERQRTEHPRDPNQTTDTSTPILIGYRRPNSGIQYRIKATVTHNGHTQEVEETVVQDERDIIRQEYVDYRTWRDGFRLHVPYRNRIVEASDPALRGNYNLVLDSAMTALAQEVRANCAGAVRISSGWRNPRRNRAVNSTAANSNHQHGGAVDLQPSGTSNGTQGTVQHRAAYLELYNAALATPHNSVLLERNATPLYPRNEAVPVPSPADPDTNADGVPDRFDPAFGRANHVHIDRSPPNESEDD